MEEEANRREIQATNSIEKLRQQQKQLTNKESDLVDEIDHERGCSVDANPLHRGNVGEGPKYKCDNGGDGRHADTDPHFFHSLSDSHDGIFVGVRSKVLSCNDEGIIEANAKDDKRQNLCHTGKGHTNDETKSKSSGNGHENGDDGS